MSDEWGPDLLGEILTNERETEMAEQPTINQARAAEIVGELRSYRDGRSDMAIDLFCHFVEVLDIKDTLEFAEQCGYPIASNVSVIR